MKLRTLFFNFVVLLMSLWSFGALANVSLTINPTALSVPAGNSFVSIPNISGLFSSVGTYSFPDGNFSISNTSGTYGSFTVSAGVVSNLSGALVISGSIISFDLTKLARVKINSSNLSVPSGMARLIVNRTSNYFYKSLEQYLPTGSYEILNNAYYSVSSDKIIATYGTFSVNGIQIASTTGSLIVNGSDISFDLTKLAHVQIDPSMISFPSGKVRLALGEVTTAFYTKVDHYLPNGNYNLATYTMSLAASYGTFKVTDTLIESTTGSLVNSNNVLTFDNSKLAKISIDSGPLSIPEKSVRLTLDNLSPYWVGLQDFHLPSGTYRINIHRMGAAVFYGTFKVNSNFIESATAPLINTDNVITFDLDRLT